MNITISYSPTKEGGVLNVNGYGQPIAFKAKNQEDAIEMVSEFLQNQERGTETLKAAVNAFIAQLDPEKASTVLHFQFSTKPIQVCATQTPEAEMYGREVILEGDSAVDNTRFVYHYN